MRTAVKEGWDRTKRIILISDAANIVTAMIFYPLAVGGVQDLALILSITAIIDIVVIFLFTHPMMEPLIRTRSLDEGYKLSGLDPEHLGTKNSLVYAGCEHMVVRGESAMAEDESDEAGDDLSTAERRHAVRLAAMKAEGETVDDASVETTDSAAGVAEGEEN